MDLLQLPTTSGTGFPTADSLLPSLYNASVTVLSPLQAAGASLTTASSQAVAVIDAGGQGSVYSSNAASIVTTAQPSTIANHSIAFISADVLDSDILLKGLQPGVEIHVLQSSELSQAIQQITATLTGRSGLTSLQIFSHGSDGNLQLGNGNLNASNLATYSSEIHSWASALVPGSDILLYGCDVAASNSGKAFVQQISQLTGADVAASIDLTGNTVLGGNWTLEFHTGAIETPDLLQPWAQAAYSHILATFTVTNTSDSGTGSLRQAIQDANAAAGDDIIVFSGGSFGDQTPDTITLTSGQLQIGGNLTIAGTGAGLLSISGNNASRVFQIDPTINATIADVTITNGRANDGAGVFNNGGSVALLRTTFNNNVATNVGGGILNAGGLLVNGGTFNSNRAAAGAGLYNAGGLEVRNSNFNTNQASLNGGGIYNNSGASLTVDNDYLSRNTAGNDGGGIYNRSGSTLSLLTSVIVDGTAGRLGGGIANFGTITSIDNSLIRGNRSTGGSGAAGGVFNGGTANITNTSILGNTAAGPGGGLYNNAGATLTLRANSLVSGNRGARGGGIYNEGSATVGESSIISNRTNALNGVGPDVSGAFISEGFNTIYSASGSTGFSPTLGDTIIFG
ncbi:DUF4347 domain-containing protein [Stenomitos frigidus]|uniref:DUF4347 domain-containing protein n=1 Tax=Stenomitos frigidus ULC18 TaxID=2107698 RepID=A0A2T1DTB0_9CYAN|nr:DUF4347 domain-containing protein [Stenomitos frigidus]PSB23738.1 hypothetical protein C7B82_29850 [Stenomitos frigidus ULC18]